MFALVATLLAATALPQGGQAVPQPPESRSDQPLVPATGPQETFQATVGADAQVVVAANRRSIDCLSALIDLTATVGWNLLIDSQPLRNDLGFHRVDLYFDGQSPRMIAQLIAVAGGADVVLDDTQTAPGARPTLHVVRNPDPATESGRQRLRTMAGQWYRSFLVDELQNDPIVVRESMQVRMNLGQLLIDGGDLPGAIEQFRSAFEKRPDSLGLMAVLRIAQCHLDLAATLTDRKRRGEECRSAEEWVRKVFEVAPSAPEVTPATVLLGRAILGQAEAAEDDAARRAHAERCQADVGARVLRLIDSVEMLDVWLILGESHRLLGAPARVHESMLTLRESPNFEDMRPDQYVSYHFLLGSGALGIGKHDLAMRALEWFLLHAEGDARRGMAYVQLAETYLAQGRFVQARAAAIEARERHLTGMDQGWRQRSLEVWARSALSLGEKDLAFTELEQLLVRGEEPKLAMFVVAEMIADRQWQRAIVLADRYLTRQDAIGDRARWLKVKALYEQAAASNRLDDFPAAAISLVTKVEDEAMRRQIATWIGDAYAKLGKLEHAADAYRGILR
ncbi:MAG: hypothetical protein RL398_369 [Planctomycetota bacterium]